MKIETNDSDGCGCILLIVAIYVVAHFVVKFW